MGPKIGIKIQLPISGGGAGAQGQWPPQLDDQQQRRTFEKKIKKRKKEMIMSHLSVSL